MTTGDKGLALIKQFEGCSLKAYKLPGERYYTIGYGHSFDSAITAGTVDDWARETFDIATQCYVYFRPGAKVAYNDISRWTPVIEQQLLRAGLRLASVLNSIYR